MWPGLLLKPLSSFWISTYKEERQGWGDQVGRVTMARETSSACPHKRPQNVGCVPQSCGAMIRYLHRGLHRPGFRCVYVHGHICKHNNPTHCVRPPPPHPGLGFPTQITCTCRLPSSTGCRRKPQKPPRMCRCHGDPWALSRLPSHHLRQLTHPCTSLAWLVPGPGRRQQSPGNLRWPALASTLSLLDGASTGVQPFCGSPQSLCRPWSQNWAEGRGYSA